MDGDLRMAEQIVECLSSHSYADRPIAFQWKGERMEIRSIVSRWRTPDGHRFLVKTEDGQLFELNYLEAEDDWSILLR
jgi:hypothetical protein